MATEPGKKNVTPPNAGKGRPKGVPNKFNGDVKGMILQALNMVGGEAYLAKQANENPVAFMGLVGKCMAQTVNANVDGSIKLRWEADAGNSYTLRATQSTEGSS